MGTGTSCARERDDTDGAERRGEIVAHMQEALGGGELSEAMWALAIAVQDEADAISGGLDGHDAREVGVLMRYADELRAMAATRAMGEAARPHIDDAAVADSLARVISYRAEEAVSHDGLTAHVRARITRRVTNFGLVVRALPRCIDAMARAWRGSR